MRLWFAVGMHSLLLDFLSMSRTIGIFALALSLMLSSVAQALPCHHGNDQAMPAMASMLHDSGQTMEEAHHRHGHVSDESSQGEMVPSAGDQKHSHDCVCPSMHCCSATMDAATARLAPQQVKKDILRAVAAQLPVSNTISPEDRPPQRQ